MLERRRDQRQAGSIMVDQFSKKELSTRLRRVLDELEKVSDEIIITYLEDDDETADTDRNPDQMH